MKLNLFSYIQMASAFYNIDKGQKVEQKVGKVMEKLTKNLYELQIAIKNSKNIGEKKKQVVESLENVKKILKEQKYILKLFEPPYPDLIFISWDDFVSGLEEFLKEWYTTASSDKARALAQKTEAFSRKFDKCYYIETVAKSAKDASKEIVDKCTSMLTEVKNAYEELGYSTAYFEAGLIDRGLFGASQDFGKFLFEIALEFDPYFNTPVIPASSIKGAFRAVYENLREHHWPKTNEVFGSSEPEANVGDLIFSDAYPVKPGFNGMILYPDILNPHYSREGEDILSETGWEPIPNPYLTVAPGTTFGFLIASPERRKRQLSWDKLGQVARAALDIGLGGKTCVGYGRFSFNINSVKLLWGGEKG